MARKPINNTLNDLTGGEWLPFTKTWFISDSRRYHRNKNTELHPARFPEEMVAEFLRFFSKRGGWVLDPFAGSGATLVACAEEGRRGVGVELLPRYAEVIRLRVGLESLPQYIMNADARAIPTPDFWAAQRAALADDGLPFVDDLPRFNFSISSPPYGAMLHTSRGGVYSKQQQRKDQGLDTVYSTDARDLGNITAYDDFLTVLRDIYIGVGQLLHPDAYLVIVIQNFRAPGGHIVPLAWDLARALSPFLFFQGERIWCQNSKPLGIWGYPNTFVPNYHHHYCLIFRNRHP